MNASPVLPIVPPMVSRACGLFLRSPAKAAERLTAGSRTAVYRVALRYGPSVIVKLYSHTARRNALTEATAIRAVSAAVPVPRVLGYGTTSTTGATALITSDLGPDTLGSAVRSGSVPRLQALRDLGTLLGRVHEAPVTTAAPRRPAVETVVSLSRRCSPDVLDRLAPALAIITGTTDKASTVWCHGDPHLDNVVLAGTRQTRHLVDFTDAAPRRREADLAHALVMTDAHAQWDRHALLGAYPHAVSDTHLAAWLAFVTVSCWTHASPGSSNRTIWSDRLAELSRRTPHLFRPHTGHSHAPNARRRAR